MPRPTPLLALALVPLLPGCGKEAIVCTGNVADSVDIQVVDEQGNNVPDARVTYRLNGGSEQQARCVSPISAGGACSRWAAGQEETGDFVIQATSADGTRHAEGQASVDRNECHVNTQQLQLTLR
jgi:GAF domain-containing protein